MSKTSAELTRSHAVSPVLIVSIRVMKRPRPFRVCFGRISVGATRRFSDIHVGRGGRDYNFVVSRVEERCPEDACGVADRVLLDPCEELVVEDRFGHRAPA